MKNTFESYSETGFNSKAELEEQQDTALQKQLHYVYQNSPFYQKHFNRSSVSIDTIRSVKDLVRLPVTTKEDLQLQNHAFFCVPSSEIIDYASTSGTTGSPVTFGLTEHDLERLATNECLSFRCAGVTKNDTVQLMTTMDRRFMAGLAYFLGLRKLGASVIRAGSGIPALQWESILRNNPTYIIAVPSFILKLIDYAKKNGISLNKTSVKAAICIGETLNNQDLSPNQLQQRIKNEWNIDLYSTYASTEMSTAFTECKEHCGGHQLTDLIITEVLDENNDPVNNGEIGELTITTLGVEAMPLVRFKTGDLLRKYTETCKCGRNSPRIGPVLGRTKQMIKYKGTTIYPSSIKEVLNSFDAISNHLLHLTSDSQGNDNVVVKIVSSETSSGFLQVLKEEFQANIRVIPTIQLISIEEYHQLAFAEGQRKPKWVIDDRKK